MRFDVANTMQGLALIALGVAIAGMGLYVANVDDAPGAAVIAFVLMLVAVVLGVRAARSRLPIWAGRTALAGGAVIAACAALLTHGVVAAAPLFAASSAVPSVTDRAPSAQSASAIERARSMARAAILAQNLPGLSIAVGVGADIVWAEGFGWRDIVTKAPVTPRTRFNIGTAASAISADAVGAIGMTSTRADSAADWSPGHIGEPEEDVPGFTFIHNVILRPIGIADPARPLPDDRATFYIPATQWRGDTTDPRIGRRLMPMRDLACCAGGKAFSSTPSDLVRFALTTNTESVTGTLRGGSVVTVMTRRDKRMAVAVASNMAFANTAELAGRIADAFSNP
jgi:hypothetical protein